MSKQEVPPPYSYGVSIRAPASFDSAVTVSKSSPSQYTFFGTRRKPSYLTELDISSFNNNSSTPNKSIAICVKGGIALFLFIAAIAFGLSFGLSASKASAAATPAIVVPPPKVTAGSFTLSALPDTAYGEGGKLSDDSIATLTKAVTSGVSTSCTTCVTTITKVVDTDSGEIVFGSRRRLPAQRGPLKVTFKTEGLEIASLKTDDFTKAFSSSMKEKFEDVTVSDVKTEEVPSSSPSPPAVDDASPSNSPTSKGCTISQYLFGSTCTSISDTCAAGKFYSIAATATTDACALLAAQVPLQLLPRTRHHLALS